MNGGKDTRRNLMIALLIPVTVVISLMIKWAVRSNIEYLTPVFESGLVNIIYIKHYCDYLEIKNGLVSLGRICVIVSMWLALLVSLMPKNKSKRALRPIVIMNSILVIALLIINATVDNIETYILVSFIVQLIFWCAMCFVFNNIEAKIKTIINIVMAVYLGASISNILEANIVGWVTDYIWLFPAFGYEYVYNIEDFIIIGASFGGYFGAAVMISIFIINKIRQCKIKKH